MKAPIDGVIEIFPVVEFSGIEDMQDPSFTVGVVPDSLGCFRWHRCRLRMEYFHRIPHQAMRNNREGHAIHATTDSNREGPF
jgi:hypothetical protein